MTWLAPEEWSAAALSLRVAVITVLVSLPVGLPLGYLLARRRFPGKWLVELLVNLPLVLPPVVTGYLLLILCGRRGLLGAWLERLGGGRIVFHWTGAVLAATLMSFPLLVRSIRVAVGGIDPRLEAAARSLGAGPVRTFFSISLPLASRGVLAGCVLAFARSLSEFGATIIVAGNIAGQTQTIPLAIYSEISRPGGLEQSWRLVLLSLFLAAGALAASEWLERKQTVHEQP